MDFTLIETLRFEPGTGFLRLDQHMRRLGRSADALGFRQPVKADAALKDAVNGAQTPLRVRLTMNFRGRVEVTVTPFEPVAENTIWRIRIAQKTRLRSDDALYRHKTSRREPYEAARAEFSPEEADEVLLLNERGEICEGSFTNVFVQGADGILMTPPLSSGLLPGILRADLIRERKARAEVLKPENLHGRPLFVGNALRGLIRAELVEAVEKAVA
ncbi:aminotransferase class IV family protein [Allorhizobium undicola]|uniref:aminotransferase class IV family protein n=1 Tax=Allorhizobium undicola TaxID=78527 RepID=UPI003D34CBA3